MNSTENTGTPVTGESLSVEVAGLTYSIDKLPSRGARRSVVTVRTSGSDGPALVTDRLDLFSFRSRRQLAQLVADVAGRDAGEVLGALALVLDLAERTGASDQRQEPVVLSPERRKKAEMLLTSDDVLDLAASAMTSLGHVGEDPVKRIAYLVATSRKLEKPLSALLLAPSASGKSAVLDAVAGLMPSEDVVPLARLTAQSLFYMGEDALKNKLVLVDELEGAGDAEHPLRVLQSKGELRLSLTVKGQAQSLVARGPVAVMSGTTRSDVDIQNTSRCLVLSLDDSREQTRRVQAAQAATWARERRPRVDVEAWQDAQRLIEPLDVTIPFARKLSFPARTTADRRTAAQVLSLVAAHALLHQVRRERDREGRVVAEVADYAAVYALLRPVVAESVDGLSPRAARAYRVLAEAGEGVTRRELADKLGWHYMTAARALDELVAQELVRVSEREPPARYRPVAKGVLADATEDLTPPEAVA